MGGENQVCKGQPWLQHDLLLALSPGDAICRDGFTLTNTLPEPFWVGIVLQRCWVNSRRAGLTFSVSLANFSLLSVELWISRAVLSCTSACSSPAHSVEMLLRAALSFTTGTNSSSCMVKFLDLLSPSQRAACRQRHCGGGASWEQGGFPSCVCQELCATRVRPCRDRLLLETAGIRSGFT